MSLWKQLLLMENYYLDISYIFSLDFKLLIWWKWDSKYSKQNNSISTENQFLFI